MQDHRGCVGYMLLGCYTDGGLLAIKVRYFKPATLSLKLETRHYTKRYYRQKDLEMALSDFELRELNKDDFDSWRRLWSVYLAFYNTSLNELIYETTFARLVSKDNTSQNGIVACKNDEMVGLVHYIFHPDNWNIEDDCYLQDLFVVETARSLGVGRSLIEAVYAKAAERGSPGVFWLTEKTNKQARALYDKVARATSFIEYSHSIK